MPRIFSYGTLRKGQYNHDRFNGIEYVDTFNLPGFELHHTGYGYPGVILNPNEEVVVDELLCTEQAYQNIKMMEEGAGYLTVPIIVNEKKGFIFVYENKLNNRIKTNDYLCAE